MQYLLYIVAAFLLGSCQSPTNNGSVAASSLTVEPSSFTDAQKAELDTATFAGGCFWCTEAVFERTKGVVSVVSGYAGGDTPDPTYQEVSAGRTNYAEAVQVYYDPEVVTYADLVKVYYGTIDPTQVDGQGPDIGKQYRSVVFYQGPEQEKIAEAYQAELSASGKYDKPIAVKIQPYSNFYPAEDYHQNYYDNNPSNPYVQSVAVPKVKKFEKNFPDLLREKSSS